MTSFSDERPLSRRELREKLRAQQAQDSVLRSKPASAEDKGNDETPGAQKGTAGKPDKRESAGKPAAPQKDPKPESVSPSVSSGDADDVERPLTRRELRALRAATGMTPVIDADASNHHPEKPVRTESSAKPPVGGSQTDEAQPPAAPKAAKSAPGPKDSAPAQPQESDHNDSTEQISEAFRPKTGKEDEVSSRSEPARAFDTLIAPEARGSDVLTTSSVLLLPGAAGQSSSSKASLTGEIIVTGSMDLPHADAKAERSSSDRPDVDSGADNSGEGTATAGTPVSATRAVSTHAVTRDVITPPTKTSSSKLLMILAITAGVLCVAVIGVVIVGLLTNSF